MTSATLQIVEVGPRDGFQSIDDVIPTESKIALIDGLYASGVRRMEATAFVSTRAVPQLADASDVLAHANDLPGLDCQVLVPSVRQAERALDAGTRHIAFVLSVSEKHNLGNVKRTPEQSVADYAAICDILPAGTKMRLNLATAFDCPYDGSMPAESTLRLLDALVPIFPSAEICLCDTTGRVTPDRVASLFHMAADRFPGSENWAFHGHDTFGLGVANAVAAWNAGISVLDSSFAGLGGCPFAPGATGNVATEDLVWTFEAMGVGTSIDLTSLLSVADQGTRLSGAQFGGRVRDAVRARACIGN